MSSEIQLHLSRDVIEQLGLRDNEAKAKELACCHICSTSSAIGYASHCQEHKARGKDYSSWCCMLRCHLHEKKPWHVCIRCGVRVHCNDLSKHDKIHPPAASLRDNESEDGVSFFALENSLGNQNLEESEMTIVAAPEKKRRRLVLSDVIETRPPPDKLTKTHFRNDQTRRYFNNDLKCDDGAQQLVYRAMTGVQILRPNDKISKDEAEYHVRLAKFLKGLSKLEREEFSYLIEKGYMGKKDSWKLSLPTSINDFQHKYIGGANSLIQSLPHPRAEIFDGHAKISLIEIFAFAMAFNPDIELTPLPRSGESEWPRVVNIEESESYQMLLRKAELKIMAVDPGELPNVLSSLARAGFAGIREWSDDFDAASVKRNKGSMWIFVISFGAPVEDRNSTRHVYPVALGRKGDSHDSVLKKHNEELEQLKNGMEFYHGGLKKMVKVFADVQVVPVDRPERTSLTKTSSHVGNCTKRCHHVAPLFGPASKEFFEKLPACPECFRCNVDGSPLPQEGCKRCTNWSFNPSGTADKSLLDECVGKHYPVGVDGCKDAAAISKARPVPRNAEEAKTFVGEYVELTFDFLKASVMVCFDSIWARKWTKAQGHEYLRLCGLQEAQIKEYCSLAHDQQGITDYSCVTVPTFPPSWTRDVDLFRYIDSPMHMLFLGVVESTIELLSAGLSKFQKHAPFARKANATLDMIRKLSLDFLRAAVFSGKKFSTGPWVSEQFLAFARVCKALYGNLEIVNESMSPGNPLVDQMCCVVASMSAMISRVMTRVVDDGTIKDTDRHIKMFLSAVDSLDKSLHPPIRNLDGAPSSTSTNTSVENATRVIDPVSASAVATTSAAAAPGKTSEASTSVVRHAAGPTESAGAAGHSNNAKKAPAKKKKARGRSQWWFSFTNYMCLLNIPKMMRLFGPLVLYWEGAGAGEKCLQEVKHLIHGGSRPGEKWLVSTLNTVFQWKALNGLLAKLQGPVEHGDIVDDYESDEDGETKKCEYGETKKYFRYDSVHLAKSEEQLETAIASGFPVSAVLWKRDGKEMILAGYKAAGGRFGWKLVEFFDEDGVENSCGLWFSRVSLKPIDVGQELQSKASIRKAATNCLALIQSFDGSGKYCAVASNWTERTKDGVFSLPNVPSHLFQSSLGNLNNDT